MDIMATGDGWAFRLGADGFRYAVDKKTGDLSLVIDTGAKYKRDLFMVEGPRGIFIETIKAGEVVQTDGDGNQYCITLSKEPIVLRYKKLPEPNLTPIQINKGRHKVTRTLVDDQPYGAGVPDTLIGVIKWAQKHLESIPEKSRRTARCRFDTYMSYGETYPHVEVSYEEAETDEEVIARVKIERERDRLADIVKRQKFEQLKRELKEA